jgi:alpha-tubulin suppressor-like RCC1 family protein
LGDGTTIDSSFPVAVSKFGILNGLNIFQITEGIMHTCVIANDSKAYCWGRNV